MAIVALLPAYGRTYKTVAEMVADWKAGKDFQLDGPGGAYCSIRDLDYMKRRFWAEDIVLHERRNSLTYLVAAGLGV